MNARLTRTAAALAAGLVLLVAGCGSDKKDTSSPASTPAATVATTPGAAASSSAEPSESASPVGQTITIDLVNGKPSKKLDATYTVNKGDTITLVITSDKAYEVHVHATDTKIEVTPGPPVTKTITVDAAPGSYEVEVEDTGFKLFTIVVK